ncbi:MAG: exodeoxyribonuclease VII large subunit [Lentimonas sp.]|jgi:exodeoxyribonuclease VII large subunit
MLDNPLKPSAEQVLKVSELTHQIKSQLEGQFRQVWVQGEVSNLRRQSSGHVYFSLKDAASQLPCVLFNRDAAQLSFELADGMELVLFGDLSVYAPHGRYQLIAKLAIQSGEGRLQMEFERLKRKLAAEGLFEKARKKALPALPLKIAVITSPSGAAVQDFLRILRRRNYAGHVVIFPARVQGRGAAEEIGQMLEYAGASKNFDLVVLTRGGGSIEDLWAFNEESLARKIAACPLPVISAVGHEIDTVLSDYVADQRAETPSAAAELISSLYLQTCLRLKEGGQKLKALAIAEIDQRQRPLLNLQSKLRIIAPDRQVAHLSMRLDDFENKLSQALRQRLQREKDQLNHSAQALREHHPRTRIGLAQQSLNNAGSRLLRSLQVDQSRRKEGLKQVQKRLENSSLKATLKRGYTITRNPDGTVIDRAVLAQKETELSTEFYDGSIRVQVKP